jgi:hypothetical protein
MKLNSSFRYGNFACSPMTGEIVLKMNSYLTEEDYNHAISDPAKLHHFLSSNIVTTHYAAEYQTPKILFSINEAKKSIFDYLN